MVSLCYDTTATSHSSFTKICITSGCVTIQSSQCPHASKKETSESLSGFTPREDQNLATAKQYSGKEEVKLQVLQLVLGELMHQFQIEPDVKEDEWQHKLPSNLELIKQSVRNAAADFGLIWTHFSHIADDAL
eukprot:4667752-Amphidinium_carterae.1